MENKLKIILLGDSGVGKTSLINQYVFKKFQHKGPLDFQEVLTKQLEIDGRNATLQILDTNGRERHGGRGLEATFFSEAKGCMLVYDVNDPNSFDNLENWHNELNIRGISYQSDSKSFPVILLGNKIDENNGKNVEGLKYPGGLPRLYERALKWCENKGQIHHFLTSAKENINVVEAFHYIAKLTINNEVINSTNEPKLEQSEFGKDKLTIANQLDGNILQHSINRRQSDVPYRVEESRNNKTDEIEKLQRQPAQLQNTSQNSQECNPVQDLKKGFCCIIM